MVPSLRRWHNNKQRSSRRSTAHAALAGATSPTKVMAEMSKAPANEIFRSTKSNWGARRGYGYAVYMSLAARLCLIPSKHLASLRGVCQKTKEIV